jgi:hypothetical protein
MSQNDRFLMLIDVLRAVTYVVFDMWCAISATRTVGPMFSASIHSHLHITHNLIQLFEYLYV